MVKWLRVKNKQTNKPYKLHKPSNYKSIEVFLFVKNTYIKNFRNIDKIETDFSDGHNIFLGNNGEGKTNLLEAIFFSCMNRSFRTRTVSDLKNFNADDNSDIYTKSDIDYGNFSRVIENQVTGRKKIIKIDGIEENSDFLIDNNSFVTFVPDDLKILKNDPVYRRKFLNEICSQIFPGYYNNLIKYRKILNNRNYLLKSRKPFELWDDLLTESACFLLEKREKCIGFLKEIISDSYSRLSSGKEIISMEYKGNLNFSEVDLKDSRENDIRNGYTCVGPHRDDIIMSIDNHEFRKTASQGQFRTAVFALKMAQAEILSNIKKTRPVIILDDVFSELDRERKHRLLKSLEGAYQTFISSNYLEDDILIKMKEKKTFFIREGRIEKEGVFKSL
jgi:DNA replication and repair protein RecF